MDILARGIANFTGKSGRSLSPALWSNIPLWAIDPNSGVFLYEDFNAFKGGSNAYYGQAGPYTSYEDTGGAIAQIATDFQGVAQIETDGTDNDEVWLQRGSATSVVLYKVSATAPCWGAWAGPEGAASSNRSTSGARSTAIACCSGMTSASEALDTSSEAMMRPRRCKLSA